MKRLKLQPGRELHVSWVCSGAGPNTEVCRSERRSKVRAEAVLIQRVEILYSQLEVEPTYNVCRFHQREIQIGISEPSRARKQRPCRDREIVLVRRGEISARESAGVERGYWATLYD